MSDIIFTPPASSGGTTINPTNNFIPKRSNATTFVDSVLRTTGNNNNDLGAFLGGNYTGFYLDFINRSYQFGAVNNNNLTKLVINDSAQFIGTFNLNEPKGLYIEYPSKIYYLGDWNNYNGGTSIKINDLAENIYTTNNGFVIGLNFDFASSIFEFGDFSSVSSGTSFYIDQANSTIYTKHSGQQEGLYLDFVNDYFQIGDFAGTNNGTYLSIDDDNKFIASYTNGNLKGLKLDFANTRYYFGDFNAINNNTHLFIADGAQAILFYTENLDFNGTALQSNTTSGASGEYLVITLNGVQYKIALDTP